MHQSESNLSNPLFFPGGTQHLETMWGEEGRVNPKEEGIEERRRPPWVGEDLENHLVCPSKTPDKAVKLKLVLQST